MKRRITKLIDCAVPLVQDEGHESIQTAISSSKLPVLLEIDSILSDFQPFFEDNCIPPKIPFVIGLEWCSPKLKALVDVLVEYHSPTFQGIVFVEQRQVATCLARVLPCISELKGIIQCAELVGQPSTENCLVKGTAYKNHRDIVRSFRQKSINLRKCSLSLSCSPFTSITFSVIATSVAEEGLDFPVRSGFDIP